MSDYLVRATAAQHQIRAFAATTRELVEKARLIHHTTPVATAALGRLLTAGSMMGAMLKGEKDILTIQIKGDGPLKGLLVTADAKSNVRGYVHNPQVELPLQAKGKLDVGRAVGAGILRVIKDLGLKEPYVGQTALVSGEIAEDLTYYFAASEQVPSAVALGVLIDTDYSVKQAGGLIIQVMPGCGEEVIGLLEEKIAAMESITGLLAAAMSPEQILEHLLGDFSLEILATMPTQFHCGCSQERIEKAILSIGRQDLQEIIAAGEPLEVNCHFCNTSYQVEVADLQKFL
ncbi:MAG TPA: Hsp33 family molecular chaperone HslO [Firmicutes bacterium]|jgi:molecular chaperone Hsp33|nr:Hsp33 family molecular chaperone HslO [Bacillota bacterium]HAA38085.1 Hsp33 family molecular chaperone HslO [Bacillota bacterium]